MQTRKLTLSAILTALGLILGLLERFVPLPLPGVKLGLANIVTLFALYTVGVPYAAGILAVRCILGSIFSGSVTGLIYSLTGGALSLLTMALIKRTGYFSVYGVSTLGSAFHHIGQVIAVSLVMSSPSVFLYLPVMLTVSVGTGLLIAFITCGVLRVPALSGKVESL
jgi:heptaprenyl diphosphate synthase